MVATEPVCISQRHGVTWLVIRWKRKQEVGGRDHSHNKAEMEGKRANTHIPFLDFRPDAALDVLKCRSQWRRKDGIVNRRWTRMWAGP